MAFIIFLILAVVAFIWWSKNGAKSTGRKYQFAFHNTLADRLQGLEGEPSWWDWRNDKMRNLVADTVAPLKTKSGFSLAAVELWLDASETWEDLKCFMSHAEKVGFGQIEQVALTYDFANEILARDLAGEVSFFDKNILLYLVAATKQSRGQNDIRVPDITPAALASFFMARGASIEGNEPKGTGYYDYGFEFRSAIRTATMEVTPVVNDRGTRVAVYDEPTYLHGERLN